MLTIIISSVALIISVFSLYISYRKDTYQLRVELKKGNDTVHDALRIVNDSGVSMQVNSIGFCSNSGNVVWGLSAWTTHNNEEVKFPVQVGSYDVAEFFVRRPEYEYGYCIQLPCGRTFVKGVSLNSVALLRLYFRSFLSRATRGRHGFTMSFSHLRHYGGF